MAKYIIYTCGIPEINEAVQKVLFERGYKWGGTGDATFQHLENRYVAFETQTQKVWAGVDEENYKELTFRELMELPPVHDELEEMALVIYRAINDNRNILTQWDNWQDVPWCKIRQKVEKKLGLT